MEAFTHDPAILWLVLGAFLIVFEACTVPGLGLFLVGLGAICTALLIKLGIIAASQQVLQLASALGLTALWAVLLWRPLQKFRGGRASGTQGGYNNMMGEKAVVGTGGLARGHTGQVIWSGTIMNAELGACATDVLPEGAGVIITAVSGTTLIVIPR